LANYCLLLTIAIASRPSFLLKERFLDLKRELIVGLLSNQRSGREAARPENPYLAV
jgi:hypothetical protein